MTLVKICGLTRPEDAACAVAAGADLLGVILWAGTPRRATVDQARAIREAAASTTLVGVFVDEQPEEIERLVSEIGLDRVQLHGSESDETIERFRPGVIRGIRSGDASQVPAGVTVIFDRPFGERASDDELEAHWRAAALLLGERDVLLAGRLTVDNVARAVACATPTGVDVSSGTEQTPGVKDHDLVRQFVHNAKETR